MLSRKISIIMIVVMVAFSFSGCMFLPKEDEKLTPPIIETKATEYKTEAVIVGTVKREVISFGTFKPVNELVHNFKYAGGAFLQFFFEKNDEVKKGDVVAVLDTGDLPREIRDMEIVVQRAKLIYEKATEQYNNKIISDYDYNIATLTYQKTMNQYNDLLEIETQSQIIAEEDGVISYLAPLEENDFISKGDMIFKIIMNNDMKLTATGQIYKFDDSKKVILESLNHTIEGTITVKNTRNMVIVPDEMFDDWKIGTSVMISQNLNTVENVLKINQKAVHQWGGVFYARILVDGVPVEKAVELGETDGKYYVVLSGVVEGDLAVVY